MGSFLTVYIIGMIVTFMIIRLDEEENITPFFHYTSFEQVMITCFFWPLSIVIALWVMMGGDNDD